MRQKFSACKAQGIPHANNNGFTLIEMLIVIAIIGILASLMAPSLVNAVKMSKMISCSNNLKQFYLAFTSYADDNRGFLPPLYGAPSNGHPYWNEALYNNNYIQENLFTCPEMPDKAELPNNSDYALNCDLFYPSRYISEKLSKAQKPSIKILLLDSYKNRADGEYYPDKGHYRIQFSISEGMKSNYHYGRPAGRHLKSCNILKLDGHVDESIILNQSDPLLEDPFYWWDTENRQYLKW